METFIAPIWRGEYDAPLRNMHPSLRDKVDAPYFEAALAQLHHTLGDCGGTVCMHIKEGVRNVHGQAVRDEARVLKFGNGRRVHFRLEWVKGQLSSISIAAADGLPLDLHPSELTSVDLFVQRGVELLAAWYQTEDVSKLLHPALVDAAGGIEGLQALQLSARAADAPRGPPLCNHAHTFTNNTHACTRARSTEHKHKHTNNTTHTNTAHYLQWRRETGRAASLQRRGQHRAPAAHHHFVAGRRGRRGPPNEPRLPGAAVPYSPERHHHLELPHLEGRGDRFLPFDRSHP
eukprot:GGOE01025803.1.p1 GENE.GGOE01025803.1~~GGOE01025803.1.p1  ORF type:complete len:310 (+),score=43.52 GGOE01025803.1:63-932(+)